MSNQVIIEPWNDSFPEVRLLKTGEGQAEWGTTGTCAGFALATACCLEERGRVDALLMKTFSDKIFYWERLLVLSMYQAAPRGIQPHTIRHGVSEEEDQLILKMFQTYQTTLERETPFQIAKWHPSSLRSSVKAVQIPSLPFFRKRSPFFLILYIKGENLAEHHLIYIHPSKGIIADEAFGGILQVKETALSQFGEIFKRFLTSYYPHRNSKALSFSYTGLKRSCFPLRLKNIAILGKTAFQIARHSGFTFGVQYTLAMIAPHWVQTAVRLSQPQILTPPLQQSPTPEQAARAKQEAEAIFSSFLQIENFNCKAQAILNSKTTPRFLERLRHLADLIREKEEIVATFLTKDDISRIFFEVNPLPIGSLSTEERKEVLQMLEGENLGPFAPHLKEMVHACAAS